MKSSLHLPTMSGSLLSSASENEMASSPPRRAPKIAVIVTCFNRRQKTVASIDSMLAQTALPAVALDFFITDDGSTDGTAEAILQRCPGARVLLGNGSLFWNGGMRLAMDEAFKGNYDFFLWLNDDTFLYPDALQTMLDTHASAARRAGRAGIVVGSTHDERGRTSYGGERQRSRLRPLTLVKLDPLTEIQRCDTFNGNCVLVSREAAEVLGNLDAGFIHAMGDTDYGFRARKAGIPMWVMPAYAGRCVDDAKLAGSFHDRSLPLSRRLKAMLSPKGLPWRAWLIVCRRHAGYLWPLYWMWPYLKVLATSCHLGQRKHP
ncbi:glycosyltransferase family 2 protein [Massilia horti]|uniref:Glycosyltransferase family 2 protein n=2 Tax=Massilia horti TaxID=2562153 RepID=A0A4Y9T5U7_9BURK|nr:glycosyltransferase family 2 protein [Massilia horti]